MGKNLKNLLISEPIKPVRHDRDNIYQITLLNPTLIPKFIFPSQWMNTLVGRVTWARSGMNEVVPVRRGGHILQIIKFVFFQ